MVLEGAIDFVVDGSPVRLRSRADGDASGWDAPLGDRAR